MDYLSIKETGKAKQNIKRSIFIGNSFYTDSEEKAKGYIKEISEENKNATHNCWAYRVFSNSNVVSNYSDAGEPHGSAGMPIFSSIEKMNLHNVVIIVTRYFGGVKLGIRGLIDAYKNTALKSIKNTYIYNYSDGSKITFKLSYKYWDEFNRLFKEKIDFSVNNLDFLESITATLSLKKKNREKILSYLNNKKINLLEEEKITFIGRIK